MFKEDTVENEMFMAKESITTPSLFLLSRERVGKISFVKQHILFGLGVVSTAEFPLRRPGNALLYGEPDPENIPTVTADHFYSFYSLGRERRTYVCLVMCFSLGAK